MVGGLRQPTKGLFMNVNDTDAVPTYLGRGDPAGRFADYYPAWFERLAETPYAEGFLDGGA
jgi:hypothetical protein